MALGIQQLTLQKHKVLYQLTIIAILFSIAVNQLLRTVRLLFIVKCPNSPFPCYNSSSNPGRAMGATLTLLT